MEKTKSTILLELVDCLPEFSNDFLLGRTSERTITTRIGYARDFKAFLSWLLMYHKDFTDIAKPQDITIEDLGKVTPVDIDRYITWYEDKHSPSATARAKVSIAAFYKYLVNTLQVLERNPVTGAGKVKIPKKDFVTYLSAEEQTKLINTIEYGSGLTKKQLQYWEDLRVRDLAIVILFLDTGLRVSELAGIDIGDLDLDKCSVIVKRKRNKLSEVYFSDEAKSYIEDYLDERKTLHPTTLNISDPLFMSKGLNRLSVREIEKIIPKYVKAALPEKNAHISPHKLRSSFAMGFYSATKDILTLQEKMGHSSLVTTNVYAKAAEGKSREMRNWK